jgi:hypothetical protein
VLAGYESPEGELNPVPARGFWFDENGRLVKTFFAGLESRRLEFQEFGGVQIAHKITLLNEGQLAMLIRVADPAPAETISPGYV